MTPPPTSLRQESESRIRANGLVVYKAAALGLRPDPNEKISEWAESHRVVPEIGALPGPWRNSVAPYLVEPMDALSPDDPTPEVDIEKPSQSGGSAIAENFLGFIMHRAPGPAMYIQATIEAAKDWVNEKLQPTIQATPALSPARGGVVAPQKSRSGEGTTSKRIRFRGGFLLLGGANSAASLRQHSIRYMVRDDLSAWTSNADKEGNPRDLSAARLKTYKVFGLSKELNVSSPKFKGSDIDADYQKSDMRRYYMACKGCGAITDHDWEDVQKNAAAPFRCHLVCPVCKTEHFEGDKADMVALGKAYWIPTAPDADGVVPPKTIMPAEIDIWRTRHTGRVAKGYAITGVINTFDRWDDIAAAQLAAGDDPEKLQPFENTVLGRPYEPKGEGPSWEVIAARKEPDWQRGTLPAGVLFVTLTADVQADGIYWAFIGWGRGKQAWHMDHGFLPGPTDEALAGAWPKLDQVADHGVSFGGVRIAADLIAVDSGYNAEAVYEWVRRRHNALAVKGDDGWSKPPISRSKTAEVRTHGLSAGKAKTYGIRVWMIGTWSIKATLILFLGKVPEEGKGGLLPTGYQHFAADTEPTYFQHLTSEFIKTVDENGEKRREFGQRGANHWLDCATYAYALTHFAGLWAWSEEQWDARARELTEMTKPAQGDMFGAPGRAVAVALPAEDDDPPSPPATPMGHKPKSDGLDALSKLNR